MPGIPSPYCLDGLQSGITIIYGPNGSGKSTTARALQALIWPSLSVEGRYAVAGRFTLDDTPWTIDVDAGRESAQRAGIPSEPPNVGPASQKDRYILTLDQLLHAQDESFAEYIWRESVGGYDLNAAVSQLGYKPVAPRRGQNHERLARIATQRRERTRQDHELVRAEDTLTELRTRLVAAISAVNQAALLSQVLNFKHAEAAYVQARAQVAEFPADLARLTGTERQSLDHVTLALETLRQERASLVEDIAGLQQAQRDAGRPMRELTEMGIAELRARLQDLQRDFLAIENASSEMDTLAGMRDAARAQVGTQVPDDSLSVVAPEALRRFALLAVERDHINAEVAALRAFDVWLGTPQETRNIDQLRTAIDVLRRRLRQPEASSDHRQGSTLTIAGAVLLIVAGGAGILLANIGFAVFIVCGLILLALAMRKPRSSSEDMLGSELTALGLPPPATWDVADVTRKLGEFEAALRESELDAHRQLLLRERDEDRRRVHAEEARWTTARDAAVAAFGIAPELSGAGLTLLASRLEAWQSAEAQCQGYLAKRASLQRQKDANLDSLNARLATYGFEPAQDLRTLETSIAQLHAGWQELDRESQSLRDAELRLKTSLNPAIAGREEEVSRIYTAAAIPENDVQLLDSRLARLDDYRAAVQLATERSAIMQDARLSVAEHEDLLALDAFTLQTQQGEAYTTANQLDSLREEIASIEARVREAKRAQVDTSLIIQQEELEVALLNDRNRDFRMSAGDVISSFIRDRTKDLNRPRVFHRAQQLLTQITSGTYRLDVNYSGTPSLRAIDTRTNVGHSLDELSSGTRVQLLLAVRLAFVESVEHGVRLPIMLDETLANSDERRALEIVRALATLCENGRQLFYFTAQRDEVTKWESLMRETGDVSCHTIDLAELRGLAAEQQAPLPTYIPATRVTIPLPGTHTRESYGEALHVPNVDIWGKETQGVHLWHLVTDLDLLHQLLDRGIGTWGQLQTLVEVSGLQSVQLTTDELRRIEARVHAVSVIGTLWRTGRSQKLTHADLDASQAVSDTFIDRVSALAARYDWQPKLLLEALEIGQMPGFRGKNTAQLRDYLTREGILSQEEPLSLMELRRQALGQLAVEIEQGYLAIHDLDALVAQLLPDEVP